MKKTFVKLESVYTLAETYSMNPNRIYEGVSTLKLQGITLRKVNDTDFEFEINPADLIPVLNTLRSKKGKVCGRVSPIKTPNEKVTHLFFAAVPVKAYEEDGE